MKQSIVVVAPSCYIFSKFLEFLKMSCLDSVQHRHVFKLDLFTIETPNDFTTCIILFYKVHKLH